MKFLKILLKVKQKKKSSKYLEVVGLYICRTKSEQVYFKVFKKGKSSIHNQRRKIFDRDMELFMYTHYHNS